MAIHTISPGPNALAALQDALIAYEVVLVHAVARIHHEPAKAPDLARIQRTVEKLGEEYPLVHLVRIEIGCVMNALRIEGARPVFLVFRDEREFGRTDEGTGAFELLKMASERDEVGSTVA